MNTIVVVGASLAGFRAAEAVRKEGFDGRLLILGDEPHLPYDRPPLSKEFLAGRMERDRVQLRSVEQLEAEWLLGEAAVSLDLAARRIDTSKGRELPFDGLVIATGSKPRRLGALDPRRAGVFELRTLDDALALQGQLRPDRRLVIVGCGFIGVEVASTARELGAEVAMVSLLSPLAIAGAPAVAQATRLLEAHGVALHLGRTVEHVQGEPVESVVLDDGKRLEADAVVSAVGVVPATDWLAGSGLQLDNGVLCDARLAVLGAENMVAAGDVARWSNPRCGGAPMRIEHWTNAAEQGRAAARTLVHGSSAEPHGSVPLFWSNHFTVRMQSVGLPDRADRFEVVEGSPEDDELAVAGYLGDRLVAGLTWNKPRALIALRGRLAEPLITP